MPNPSSQTFSTMGHPYFDSVSINPVSECYEVVPGHVENQAQIEQGDGSVIAASNGDVQK